MRRPSFFTSQPTSLFLFLFLFLQLPFTQVVLGAEREKIGEEFPFVGLIKYTNGPVCTGFLVKHGVLATAKHCFSHKDINELNFDPKKLKVSFFTEELDPFFPQLPLVIEGNDIIKLTLDSGSNDIAYIIYKREATIDKIDLPKMEINTDVDISNETNVFRVGFPMGENHVFDKVMTKDCQFTGKTDFFHPTITDPGYEGLLYDTDCPAWFGDSGGPVFERVENTEKDEVKETIVIHGVLAHTFEVNFAGEIEESSKERDSIGEFVKTSNFSPFRLADDFVSTLDEEERLFRERNPSPSDEETTETPDKPETSDISDTFKNQDSEEGPKPQISLNPEKNEPKEEKGLLFSIIELLVSFIELLLKIIKAS